MKRLKQTMRAIAYGYCPKSPRGILWPEFIHQTKQIVEDQLDRDYRFWKDQGYEIVEVLVKEVSPATEVRGKRK